MRIEYRPTAWRHNITGDEIRAIITYPLLRYAITTAYPDADAYVFIGRIENEPWIEVGAEDEDGETWVVFHAMLLTRGRARDVFDLSGGLIDLRDVIRSATPVHRTAVRKGVLTKWQRDAQKTMRR